METWLLLCLNPAALLAESRLGALVQTGRDARDARLALASLARRRKLSKLSTTVSITR